AAAAGGEQHQARPRAQGGRRPHRGAGAPRGRPRRDRGAGQRRGRQQPRQRGQGLRPGADPRAARFAARRPRVARLLHRWGRRPRAHRAASGGMNPSAAIAEDEPLLALALRAELASAWPELQVVDSVGDGAAAVRSAVIHRPDVLFFDIRMPGLGGLEAAAELADAWPQDAPFPALVFVTAYDQYALQAFEAQAVDYVLKPVQPARLRKTVE